jgi:hypothetical protein
MSQDAIVSKKKSTGKNPDNFAFIIGGMKCGTTSLFEILSQHPQICPSKQKEPDYFVKERDEKARDDYLALWDWNAGSHVVALESSVAYSKAPYITGVPERIYQSGLGKYRFIYMLRDPIARIESQVRHGLFAGWGKSLDAGIPEDAVDFSRYAMQLDNYLKYFPKNDVILILLEEFKSDPHTVLSRICKFLGVNNDFQFSKVEEPRNTGEFFNASPIVAHATQGKMGQFIARRLLPTGIKKWLRGFIAQQSKEKDSNVDRWRLRPEERVLILNRLAEDLRRLEADYGIDVRNYWHIPPQILDEK